MNKLLITLIGVATMAATLPALAGIDQQAVYQADETIRTASQPNPGMSQEAIKPSPGRAGMCPPDVPVLHLDHGPRAQTSPYINRLRWARYEAQVKACAKPAN
ncbi:MAG: hypothetical protein E6Q71_07220 [Pseudomonas sp.]|nr:MAG: hypothetical protein E6Q71_07220 [Pseudomonas sp.]